MTLSQGGTEPLQSWRENALNRSLDGARARSEARLQRILDAARTVIMESPDSDVTVGQVAARAGISLKTLYRFFGSKEDLLLALLTEECRLGAVILRQSLDGCADPAERMHRCVTRIFELAEEAPDYARFIYRQHQRLSVDHREEVTRALAPLVEVIEVELRDAAAVGVAHPDDPAVAAGFVLSLVVDGLAVFTASSRASPASVASIWRFVAGGIGVESGAIATYVDVPPR
jgi:AcrR family transcriptional regulator